MLTKCCCHPHLCRRAFACEGNRHSKESDQTFKEKLAALIRDRECEEKKEKERAEKYEQECKAGLFKMHPDELRIRQLYGSLAYKVRKLKQFNGEHDPTDDEL